MRPSMFKPVTLIKNYGERNESRQTVNCSVQSEKGYFIPADTPVYEGDVIEVEDPRGGKRHLAVVKVKIHSVGSHLDHIEVVWGKPPQIRQALPMHRETEGTGTAARDLVFVSYSHTDASWLERLKIHLKPFERKGTIDVWDDQRIRTGTLWRKEIQKALTRTRVAVLLVSPDFLASDFIAEHELPKLLGAEKEVTVVWVPTSPSSFEITEIAHYQAAFNPQRTLADMDKAEADRALVHVAKQIQQAFRSAMPRDGTELGREPGADGSTPRVGTATGTATEEERDYAETVELITGSYLPSRKEGYKRAEKHTHCRHRDQLVDLLARSFESFSAATHNDDQDGVIRLLAHANAWQFGPQIFEYWLSEGAQIRDPLTSVLRSYFMGQLDDAPRPAVEFLTEALLRLASTGKPDQPTRQLIYVVKEAVEAKSRHLKPADWARIEQVLNAYQGDEERFDELRTIRRVLGRSEGKGNPD